MKNGHLTEEEIQQYVLEDDAKDGMIVSHMNSCAHCQQQASVYRILFGGLEQQTPETFDFDLSALVIEKIEAAEVPKPQGISTWLVVTPIIIATLIAFLYFYGSNAAALFASVRPIALALVSTAAFTTLGLLGYDQYMNYKKKISLIELS